MDEGQLLLLWPGEVRRKREGDFGQIGPALLAGTNNSDQSIKEISSTSYFWGVGKWNATDASTVARHSHDQPISQGI